MKKTLLTLAIVIINYCSNAQSYLPLTGGTLTGSLTINGGTRLGGVIDNGSTTIVSVAPGTIGFDAPGVSGGRFYISGSNGNVGIGTTSPNATLDVNGSIAVNGAVVNGSQVIAIPADGTYVIASGARIKGTYTLTFESPNRVQTVVLLVSAGQWDVNSSLSVLCNNSFTANVVMSSFRLMFSPDLSTVYLVMDVNNRNGGTSITGHFEGNGVYAPSWGGTLPASPVVGGYYPFTVNMGTVGINTTNTQGYTFAVNGTIHSKEVKVDLTNFPDYVFKPAYQLLSIPDIKTYIDQNHHLPDMPSASEVEKNGINLGEMDKLLTKKVEELTLYLINQQKQMDELKQEIANLKSDHSKKRQ